MWSDISGGLPSTKIHLSINIVNMTITRPESRRQINSTFREIFQGFIEYSYSELVHLQDLVSIYVFLCVFSFPNFFISYVHMPQVNMFILITLYTHIFFSLCGTLSLDNILHMIKTLFKVKYFFLIADTKRTAYISTIVIRPKYKNILTPMHL